MPVAADQKVSHDRYIDALRGVAFMAVMTVHVAQHVGRPFRGDWLANSGQYGVQLFFLLSAVTLLRSLHARQGRDHNPTLNFLVRRLFRIGPLFWFGIALYAVVGDLGRPFWAPGGIRAWQVALTATFLHGWTPRSIDSVVPGGWSIAVEMTFYAVLPLVWRRIRSAGAAVAVALGCVVLNIALGRLVDRLGPHLFPNDPRYLVQAFTELWFPAQAAVFAVGIALYHLTADDRRWLEPLRSGRRAAVPLAVGLYSVVALGTFASHTLLPPQVLYAAALVPVVLALAARPYAVLVNGLTTRVGTLSFSCYLLHFAILTALGRALAHTSLSRWPAEAQFAVWWAAALAGTVAASAVTYRAIERPGIALGNRLIRLWEPHRTVDAAGERATTGEVP